MPKSSSNKKRSAASPSTAGGKKPTRNTKRKLPANFLNAQSLEFVIGPDRAIVQTPVASDVIRDIFLDRLVKELIAPYWKKADKNRTIDSTKQHVLINGTLVAQKVSKLQEGKSVSENGEEEDDAVSKRATRVKSRIVMGTNQCSRILEDLIKGDMMPQSGSLHPLSRPSLIVLAKDIYPPTMLAHIPVLARQLGITVLLLPGKASVDMGRAFHVPRTSILIFLSSSEKDQNGASDDPVDSFVGFIKSQMSQDTGRN
ncbi:hypothetical protein IV203_021152 [Nitzschia inconspicua]|uniref:Ribosomal protein L7Ae/L30e/S12e/Gadd45 domain-containing protein n=1 Tax=Nitzschia inconspicua TaxID=303405 RepID=A0A9K3KGM6_9STRA|nr:hypothetical protein IV203_021152 [Nitzschia inconspicua]